VAVGDQLQQGRGRGSQNQAAGAFLVLGVLHGGTLEDDLCKCLLDRKKKKDTHAREFM